MPLSCVSSSLHQCKFKSLNLIVFHMNDACVSGHPLRDMSGSSIIPVVRPGLKPFRETRGILGAMPVWKITMKKPSSDTKAHCESRFDCFAWRCEACLRAWRKQCNLSAPHRERIQSCFVNRRRHSLCSRLRRTPRSRALRCRNACRS